MFEVARLNRRRTRRCSILWPGTIDDGVVSKRCTITDLSEKGARLALAAAVPPRTRLKLRCDRFGELHGVVIWSRGAEAGMRFNLPAANVLRLLAPHVPGMARRRVPPPMAAVDPADGRSRKAGAA